MNKIEFLKSLGFVPVSEDLNANLEVRCEKGHVFKREFNTFKKGFNKCPICEKEEKLKLLSDLGFTPISESLGHDLEVKCRKDHIFKRAFSSFKRGNSSCPICENEEKIIFLNNLGFTPISEDLSVNLEVKCKKGHIFKRKLDNFRQGYNTCPICERKEKIELLNSLGFTPISEDLSRNLEVKCKHNHTFRRRFDDFKRGATNCPICEEEEKLKFLNDLGFKPISKNLGDHLEVRCERCSNTFKRTFGNFKNGATKCPHCEREEVSKILNDSNFIPVSEDLNDLEIICDNALKIKFSEFEDDITNCSVSEKEEKIKFLKSLGFTPISKSLNNKLEVKCENGHIFKRRFDVFKKGITKCPHCEKEEKIKVLKSLGFTPVSENLGVNLEVKCGKGHVFKRQFNDFKKGATSCPICEREEKVRVLNILGFVPVSENLNHELEVKCEKGHTFKRTFANFKQGYTSCPICEKEKKIEFLNDLGFTPVSEDLADSLEIKCEKGHTFKRTFANFKQGYVFCPICEKEERIKFLNDLGFTLISEDLVNNLEVKCEKGHIFKREFGKFKQGITKCPVCFPNNSSAELEIKEFLDSLNIEYVHSDWSTIAPQELDFYIPSYNLAIEFDGIYWHSELQGKGKDYHLEKTQKCSEKGIKLLHIFENEWINKKEIWKSIIRGKLGLNNKIGARKCVLKQVNKSEERQFLENNHLQGYVCSQVAFGLYYEGELVNLMSFGKNRFSSDVEWELLRFVSKQNTNVIGGASKLLKHFMTLYSGGIVSYSDRRYSTGDMYKTLGFQFSHFSQPNYFYFKNFLTLESRQKYIKHKLPNLLESFNPNLTEWENMVNNGYNRIWDCGNSVWKI